MKPGMVRTGLMIGAAMLVAACGGGSSGGGGSTPGASSSSTINGTTAGGAPLVGTVTVKDSKGATKSTTVDFAAAGNYAIDVTGLTPPLVLRADGTVAGTSVTYFSGIDSVNQNGSVNVNITPFTDLIIANIAGSVAANYYTNGNFSTLTSQQLNDAQQQLRDRLLPLLQAIGLDNTTDLLRASFAANGTGIDAALDMVRVTVDPQTNTATILNIVNNQQIIDDLASKTDNSQINASGVTDYQQIIAGFKTLESLFAVSIPAASNAQLQALFDTTVFKLGGANYEQLISFLQDAQYIGTKFSFALGAITQTNAKGKLTVSPPNRIPTTFEWQLNKVTVNNVSSWQSIGDQWVAFAGVSGYATNSFGFTSTGLGFSMDIDPASTIDYAIVTGKGLNDKGGVDGKSQSQGLLLVNYRTGASMGVAMPPYNGATLQLTPPRQNARYKALPLTDDVISTMQDNEEYTVVFYDDNNTPTDYSDDQPQNGTGYKLVIPKRPYLSTELAAVFPAFTSPTPTIDQLKATALNGGNLTVSWTLPAGQLADSFEFGRGTTPLGGGSITFDFVDQDLSTSALTTSFTVAPPDPQRTVASVHISLDTMDSFGRVFQIMMSSPIP
jgi:hypothetical protein